MDRISLINGTLTELCNGKSVDGMTRVELMRCFRSNIQQVINDCPEPAWMTVDDVVWALGVVMQRDPRELANNLIENK